MVVYRIPEIAEPPAVEPGKVFLVASGDLRPAP
jgi:hypothetical protein